MFRSKKEIVKQQVVQAILSGRYAAGVYLRQNTIADEFGLSSTPVREALTELQTSGLLVHHAHRGFQGGCPEPC
jgi:DNA-binding GntR family transcriptional regulator